MATNTTIQRNGLQADQDKVEQIGPGGVSGKPLANRATEVIRYLYNKSKGTIPIIGVGGITTTKDVLEKLEAGASLVQVYTGFIYQGPSMIKKLNKSLDRQFPKSN